MTFIIHVCVWGHSRHFLLLFLFLSSWYESKSGGFANPKLGQGPHFIAPVLKPDATIWGEKLSDGYSWLVNVAENHGKTLVNL